MKVETHGICWQLLLMNIISLLEYLGWPHLDVATYANNEWVYFREFETTTFFSGYERNANLKDTYAHMHIHVCIRNVRGRMQK